MERNHLNQTVDEYISTTDGEVHPALCPQPWCGGALILVKGDEVVHHWRHRSDQMEARCRAVSAGMSKEHQQALSAVKKLGGKIEIQFKHNDKGQSKVFRADGVLPGGGVLEFVRTTNSVPKGVPNYDETLLRYYIEKQRTYAAQGQSVFWVFSPTHLGLKIDKRPHFRDHYGRVHNVPAKLLRSKVEDIARAIYHEGGVVAMLRYKAEKYPDAVDILPAPYVYSEHEGQGAWLLGGGAAYLFAEAMHQEWVPENLDDHTILSNPAKWQSPFEHPAIVGERLATECQKEQTERARRLEVERLEAERLDAEELQIDQDWIKVTGATRQEWERRIGVLGNPKVEFFNLGTPDDPRALPESIKLAWAHQEALWEDARREADKQRLIRQEQEQAQELARLLDMTTAWQGRLESAASRLKWLIGHVTVYGQQVRVMCSGTGVYHIAVMRVTDTIAGIHKALTEAGRRVRWHLPAAEYERATKDGRGIHPDCYVPEALQDAIFLHYNGRLFRPWVKNPDFWYEVKPVETSRRFAALVSGIEYDDEGCGTTEDDFERIPMSA